MIRVQSERDWRDRASRMQRAIAEIDTLLRSAPEIPFAKGLEYRVVLFAQPIDEPVWPAPITHARQNSEAADRQEISGLFEGWLVLTAGTRNAQFLLTRPSPGKRAIFAETDVLEYEQVGR